MPFFCAVKGCGNKVIKGNRSIVCHRFPNDPEQLTEWIRFCGWPQRWFPQTNQGICSVHFDDSCYDPRYRLRRQLKTDAVPVRTSPTFNATNGGLKRSRPQAFAVASKKNKSTDGVITMIDDSSDDDSYEYDVQNHDDDEVEGKMCKICQSMLLPEAKYLLQHAVNGKSYKDIIQETLNIPVFYDDDENMRICDKCSNFIEDLQSFVTLCRENLAQIVAKRAPPKKKRALESSEEEDSSDYDTEYIQEDVPAPDNEESPSSDQEEPEPVIHESRSAVTVQSENLDPLHIDAGPSNVIDSKPSPKSDPEDYFEAGPTVIDSKPSPESDFEDYFEPAPAVIDSKPSPKSDSEDHFEPAPLEIPKYNCEECSFQTDEKDHLLSHVRATHTDKRPYGCTVCPSTFSNAVSHCLHFQEHKKRGEAKVHVIKCAYCRVLITKATVFERHLANKHPNEAVTV